MLRQLGYETTPVLILLSPENQVHMAAAAPRTQDDLRALASVLRILIAENQPERVQ
jgi:hypothetical protein